MARKAQPWQPTTIKRFIQAFPTSACTALVETDAGMGYLKPMGGPEGPHTLACELVATRLAKWFGLSTLDFAVIPVAPEDEIPFHKGGKAEVGPAFITRAESGEPWSGAPNQLSRLINSQDVSRLVVFDTWTLNCDRYSLPSGDRVGKPRINRNNVFLSEAPIMNPTKGYYCLIQYCPDLGRLEAANVGVLLFCPEHRFIKALTSRNNRRIIRFFGSEGHDWARIGAFKRGLEDRIAIEGKDFQTLEHLERFIAQRANLFQITPPRPMKIIDPEEDLQELFHDFIGEGIPHRSTRTLRKYVDEKLTTAGLESKRRRDIQVNVPVLEKQVEIPFGFQNGRFNLINPVRFEATNPEQVVTTACKYAVEGRSLFEHPDPQLGLLQLVVVGKFRPRDLESPARVKRVFEDFSVKLFRTSDLPQLLDEIRRTGKDVGADHD
jgi:hypothetical protein